MLLAGVKVLIFAAANLSCLTASLVFRILGACYVNWFDEGCKPNTSINTGKKFQSGESIYLFCNQDSNAITVLMAYTLRIPFDANMDNEEMLGGFHY